MLGESCRKEPGCFSGAAESENHLACMAGVSER